MKTIKNIIKNLFRKLLSPFARPCKYLFVKWFNWTGTPKHAWIEPHHLEFAQLTIAGYLYYYIAIFWFFIPYMLLCYINQDPGDLIFYTPITMVVAISYGIRWLSLRVPINRLYTDRYFGSVNSKYAFYDTIRDFIKCFLIASLAYQCYLVFLYIANQAMVHVFQIQIFYFPVIGEFVFEFFSKENVEWIIENSPFVDGCPTKVDATAFRVFNAYCVSYYMIKNSIRDFVMNLRFWLFHVLADLDVLTYVRKIDYIQPLTYEEIMLGLKGMRIMYRHRISKYKRVIFWWAPFWLTYFVYFLYRGYSMGGTLHFEW